MTMCLRNCNRDCNKVYGWSFFGTDFNHKKLKKGNEELEYWLTRMLSPKLNLGFYDLFIEGKRVILLEIEKASIRPVSFKGEEYIRIGSNKQKLKMFPEKERILWKKFENLSFEDGIAKTMLSIPEVFELLDYQPYFKLSNLRLPPEGEIINKLISEDLIRKNEAGKLDITNLGAVLFARNIEYFKSIKRKTVRVILYSGKNKIEGSKETEVKTGYALAFETIVNTINNMIPANEQLGDLYRKNVPMYPVIAVRELVANALIHQDFSIRGTGTMIEIFSDRIEITNPGTPIVDSTRFIDSPPKSRNESLASYMRRIGLCEERGSGFDKVVFQTEFYQLPAPLVEVTEEHTRVVLFAHKDFKEMAKEDKIRACYLHACLKYVNRDYLTNTSLRERFGLKQNEISKVSRIIKETLELGLIKFKDPNTSPKYYQYLPVWA